MPGGMLHGQYKSFSTATVRVNRLTYSEQISSWTAAGGADVTTYANTIVAPDGDLTGDLVTSLSATATATSPTAADLGATAAIAPSFWLYKSSTAGVLYVTNSAGGTATGEWRINPVLLPSATWVRITPANITTYGTLTAAWKCNAAGQATLRFTGDASMAAVGIWGAQIESGASATDYIKSGSAVGTDATPTGSTMMTNVQTDENGYLIIATDGSQLDVNLEEINGSPVDVGAGNVGTGTLRVTMATDDSNLAVMSAWDDGSSNANVNIAVDSVGLATEATVATLATEATVATLATEATVATLATEATAATLALESGGNLDTIAAWDDGATNANVNIAVDSVGLATEATVATLATEATVATLATEATAATLATEATVATLATEATAATLALESGGNLATIAGWNDTGYANVNMNVAGTDVASGSGAVSAQTIRVIEATDSGVVTSLASIQSSVSAGADVGNDWYKTKKEEIATYSPAATSGTAVDDSATNVVLASTEVLTYPNFTVYVKNAGGGSGDAIDSISVDASPDGTLWISVASDAALALASGSGWCSSVSGNSYRYVRVTALCGAGDDTTADAWITANKG